MTSSSQELRNRLEALLCSWRQEGAPSSSQFQNIFQKIIDWRKDSDVPGLWTTPPLMVTATLDDGWGSGLQIIHACAEAAGVQVNALGLLQPAERIIAHCRVCSPDLLGLTVLQFDSEPLLRSIRDNLPAGTRLIAGGPVFRIDPELASRTGVDYVAKNAAGFLEFLLSFST